MTGDGVYAAFGDPVGALDAAVAIQQAFADPGTTDALALRVRCGLHLGEVERRDDDYFGGPVNRASRIMGAAHGGQILLSKAVADHVRDRLPPACTVRDLGRMRLKDLALPEHVYQLVHPELRQNFPALRSLEAAPNNLPLQISSFVGRARELAEVKRLLTQSRLLTLVGIGGIGKTRLMLQAAADSIDAYPDGVWVVELGSIADAALVPSSVAQVLSVQERAGTPLTQTLCNHLKSRRLLLVLDNCEHLIEACATLAAALLAAAPDSRVARQQPRAAPRRRRAVLPGAAAVAARARRRPRVVARAEAVQMFVERIRLREPGFVLTSGRRPRSRRSALTSTASRWRWSSPPDAFSRCRSKRSMSA